MEKLHGSKKSVSHGFTKRWSNNKVTLFRQTWTLDEDLVVEVIGLQKEGTKFYRDRKFSVEATKNFPKSDEERVQLTKKDNVSYYLPQQVKSFWQKMLRVLMEYITIDASSLNESLVDHARKPKSYPISHQGLILLIYEHLKGKARANREDLLVENAHIFEGHEGYESDDDKYNIPLHKKGRVADEAKDEMEVKASLEEEQGKVVDVEVESEKKKAEGEGEKVKRKEYSEELEVSNSRNEDHHTMEKDTNTVGKEDAAVETSEAEDEDDMQDCVFKGSPVEEVADITQENAQEYFEKNEVKCKKVINTVFLSTARNSTTSRWPKKRAPKIDWGDQIGDALYAQLKEVKITQKFYMTSYLVYEAASIRQYPGLSTKGDMSLDDIPSTTIESSMLDFTETMEQAFVEQRMVTLPSKMVIAEVPPLVSTKIIANVPSILPSIVVTKEVSIAVIVATSAGISQDTSALIPVITSTTAAISSHNAPQITVDSQ
ncbi:uncharacterized protein LOC131856815 [Cryptomeria japonica]|uniref:uncharacterized protein LOC131856815 n=1 Tax=Cryptomeria japonica TaxID=3369 RepID=UPI0027DA850C|nr:uncharacterized protein LOC131856815 [Cryptomeria japonica]